MDSGVAALGAEPETIVLADPEVLVVVVWAACTDALQSQSPKSKARAIRLLDNSPMRFIVTLTEWVFLSNRFLNLLTRTDSVNHTFYKPFLPRVRAERNQRLPSRNNR
jgi:hypothetical protein